MKHLFALIAVLMLAFCSGCGGETRESMAAESVSTMKELVTVLDGVKDEATAKAAKPTLKALMEKLNGLNERQAKLPMPTEAEVKALDEKYGKELDDVTHKFAGHMMRITFDPKINAELNDLDQTMKKTKM